MVAFRIVDEKVPTPQLRKTTGIAGRYALAASGHAAAAPPSSVMNSRRFMSDMGLLPRFVPIPPFTARLVSAR